jgi:hypothetical protein
VFFGTCLSFVRHVVPLSAPGALLSAAGNTAINGPV